MTHGRTLRTIVAGATGYSGRELIRLLAHHPNLTLVGAFASTSAKTTSLEEIHPQLKGLTSLACEPFDANAVKQLDPELIFLATPNEFSHEIVPSMLETGATVIDISGAFRLRNASDYPKYYGFEHTRPDLLKSACYGLTEFVREELPGARLIANPGCYPTSVLIPVRPLLDAGLVAEGRPVIADSKSGVTGAGKTPILGTHFAEVTENFSAYNVLRHRHTPEIAQGLSLPAVSSSLIFTPHLLPINRGILSTIYLRMNEGVARRDILSVWKERFRGATFVRIFDGAQLPEIKFAAHTPYCDIGVALDETTGEAVVVSAIDNLLKGAASQAIQNANLALGFSESSGLLPQ
jgi:N-acetyl-gamma-glutamyl-phosphate reductase